MPKPPHIDTHVPEESVVLGPSRTQQREERRRTQDTLDALTQLLASMPPKALAALGLGDAVLEAVAVYKRLPHGGASARQRRLVARLLRAEDAEAVLERARRTAGGHGPAKDAERTRELEAWRARLLDEGDAGLDAFLREHPGADRQRLRQATRAAVAERAEGKSTRRLKELFQLLVAESG